MKFYVYEVEAVTDYKQPATADIDYDYTQDYKDLVELRGYVKRDYVIVDEEVEIGRVYFNGSFLFVAIEKVTEFCGNPIQIVFLTQKDKKIYRQ